MSTIITRTSRSTPLTFAEVDANFTNLNNDKTENASAAITGGTIDGTTIGATTAAAGSFTDLTVSGNLTVNGTTTTVNSTTVTIDDKNIELGSVANPTDVTADGGGITLKGATDKTINWNSVSSSWVSSENFNLASGKVYKINGVDILSSSKLLLGGALTYTAPSTIISSIAATINDYAQFVIQNKSNGTNASGDFIVNNDLSTDTTYYGNFGINSSTWTGVLGTASLSAANVVYLTSTSSDLVIGTTTDNYIRFAANNGADLVRINAGSGFWTSKFALRDTSAAFDVSLVATSSTALTANRQVTLDVVNAARSIKLAGNIDLASSFTTSGAFALTLTQTAATNVTLPTSGTLYGTATNSITSSQLETSVSDNTGTGALVFGTGPTVSLPVINNIKTGYTTIATAAGTTALTVNSNYNQYFTGTSTQTVTLPQTSTLVAGIQYVINNNSTGAVTVNTFTGLAVLVIPGGATAAFTCISTASDAVSSWDYEYITTGSGLVWSDAANTLNVRAISTEPAASAAGTLNLYAKSIGGRLLLKSKGPSGIDIPYQPSIYQNKIAFWSPPGTTATLPAVFGLDSPTAIGTATARVTATTSLFTRMRKLGYVGSATAGTGAGWYSTQAQYTVGDGAGLGGFYFVARFGCSDAATVAGAFTFVGMTSSVAVPVYTSATGNPSVLTNAIGVGCNSGDTNLSIYYGGSAAQTPIALGANFPANSLSTDMYELILFAPTNVNNVVYYRVTNLRTNAEASGTLTGVAGTALPASTTLLAPRLYRSNNATALGVSIDIVSVYIETDY